MNSTCGSRSSFEPQTHPTLQKRILTLSFVVALFAIAFTTGCQSVIRNTDEIPSIGSHLKPIIGSRDLIDVEVYYVDRHIGDPLIGESLWGSLSSLSPASSDGRRSLSNDGFRFAMSPSRPPRALQSLLSLSNDRDPTKRILPHNYAIQGGQDTVLIVSTPSDGTNVEINRGGTPKRVELNHAQCLFRLSAKQMEDGWVQFSILPEIRHGANTLRPVATAEDWQFREQQQAIPLYQHRLSADLNVGEVIVLGMESTAPDSLASTFFRANLSEGLERLIFIRVTGVRQVDPVRTTIERSITAR